MTNKEALKAWEKMYAEIDEENWLFVGTINPEMVDLAIKALKRVDCVYLKDECSFACGECGYCEAEKEKEGV